MKIMTAACVLAVLLNSAFAAEKLIPGDSKQKPEIFVQLGHTEGVKSVAFSPDGTHLLSGSYDKTLKLWEISTGREVVTFRGHDYGGVSSVVFSPDGKYALSGGGPTLKLWDISTGEEVRTVGGHNDGGIASVALSPDGRYALSGSWDKSIKLWEVTEAREISTFRGHTECVSAVAFSHDGQYALSGSKDKTIILWDIKTGRAIRTFAGHVKDVNSILFSKDDSRIFSAGSDNAVKLWDVATGKMIKTFLGPDEFLSIALSPDEKLLIGVGRSGMIKLWDLALDKELLSLKFDILDEDYDYLNSVVFSPDGNMIAIGGDKKRIVLRDVQLKKLKTLGGIVERPWLVYFSKEGTLKIATDQAKEKEFDLRGVLKTDIQHKHSLVRCVGSVPRFYIKELSPGKNAIIDSRDDKRIREISSLHANFCTISPDGQYALDHLNRIIKLTENSEVFSHELEYDKNKEFQLEYAEFSPDVKYLAGINLHAHFADQLIIWDVKSGKQIRSLPGHSAYVTTATFTPDGKYLISGSGDRTLKIWDVTTGKDVKTLIGHDDAVMSVVNNDKYILSGDWKGTLKLWDMFSGKALQTFNGHTDKVCLLNFSPDGKFILSGSEDNTVRLWDISTGKEIARFISFTDGEWIVITPEGYFNASPGGAKHLNVRVGNQVYSIDNFYEKFFNPVYVASVLQGKKIEAVADIRKGILLPPDVRITSPAPGREFSTDTLIVTVTAKDAGGGIDEIRLYHNGKAIGEDTRAVKIVSRGGEAIREYTVSLVDGVNAFRAVGFSKDRTESNPYELIVKLTAPAKDVSLYVFAVGINKYKNPALNLNYAEPDARGIADFFKLRGKGLFKNVEIKEIYNEQATKENIVSKLSQLQSINPQDAVLIYLAGHGENINDKWYFIPHELTYPEREADVKIKGISSDELSGYMKNIKAQKILLLIDACKSGAVLIAFRGFEDRKALSQLSRSTGVHIVAASTKDQFAAEVTDLGHGVFTYTLL
ncbi:MAG: caspase family protein, partial [Syntrophales bacterium]|nr:caspase family protein [Syntrophales bacterium]